MQASMLRNRAARPGLAAAAGAAGKALPGRGSLCVASPARGVLLRYRTARTRDFRWRTAQPQDKGLATTTVASTGSESVATDTLKTAQQVKEERIAPLRTALNESIARYAKAQEVREALEAKVCTIFEEYVAKEGDLQLEEVAAAAMKAVEGAVQDEVESATMVEATQEALKKVLAASVVGSYADDIAVVTTPAADLVSGSLANSSLDQAASRAPSPSSSMPPELPVEKPAPGLTTSQKFGLILLSVGVGGWLLCNTAPGLALQELVAPFITNAASHIHISESEMALVQIIWLLVTSLICVPAVVKLLPGGSPVLGYLIGGAIVGPHALGIIHDPEHVRHVAELGVVLLLFNIGLELSLERLQSMAKMVFGMGTLQVVATLAFIAAAGVTLAGLPGPGAIILGGALAMSTTAVGIQVLNDRGEMGARHGRATFSVLLLQDLAVVVLLMLIPLLAPSPDGTATGAWAIAQALGIAGVKAVACIVGVIYFGRMFVGPLYKKIAGLHNPEIFMALTLVMVLGTSLLTQIAGLSLALGAFLAGLLLAETDFHLQVESDIAPFKGLLLGLFFMSVGMEISVKLFAAKWQEIIAALVVLVVGKLAVVAALGPLFGLSRMTALRAGLLLAPGGEFAFVCFGEAVARNVLPAALCTQLYMVVALSMALTPYLAALGALVAARAEKGDLATLAPQENETKELSGHVVIAGYGRVGQIIAQMLSEQLIPFVALDVRADRVQAGKALDLPVYFGDAGAEKVLHAVGAERAACCVVALDTPGASYRTVYSVHKHYPHLKVYANAHDVDQGAILEKAGATVCVPEVLEPSLQLAGAVLGEYDRSGREVAAIVDTFRSNHLAELKAMSKRAGTTLGYGYNASVDGSDTEDVEPVDAKAGALTPAVAA